MSIMKKVNVFFVICCAVFLGGQSLKSQAHVTKIVDILGRERAIHLPAKRVVLGFYYVDYMAVGGAQAFDKVVGFSKNVWKSWSPKNWQMYVNVIPGLERIADVGEITAGTFSVEKVVSLRPDVVLLADWQFHALGTQIKRLEKLGIPVLVVDYHAQTIEKHVKSTLIFGQITGKNERAQKLARDYEKKVGNIKKILKKANRQPPRVYIEFGGFKGPDGYGTTYGDTMWGSLVRLAGGENIARSRIVSWGTLNPEFVLKNQPEYIFISGRSTQKQSQDAMIMGLDVDRDRAFELLKGFKRRKGWKTLPAIKNNRLFGLDHSATRTLLDQAMIEYIAKSLYPDLFPDLDPLKTYMDFHKKYLPVTPKGTFMISLEDSDF